MAVTSNLPIASSPTIDTTSPEKYNPEDTAPFNKPYDSRFHIHLDLQTTPYLYNQLAYHQHQTESPTAPEEPSNDQPPFASGGWA
jgi:hypothetical protein